MTDKTLNEQIDEMVDDILVSDQASYADKQVRALIHIYAAEQLEELSKKLGVRVCFTDGFQVADAINQAIQAERAAANQPQIEGESK